MGSCENSFEVEVACQPLHQTTAEQSICSNSEQDMPSFSENGSSVGTAGPAIVLDRQAEVYQNDNAGCPSLEEVSFVDQRDGSVCENGHATSLVPEDECGFIGCNLDEGQSRIDDQGTEMQGLCEEKQCSSSNNCKLVNAPEECERTCLEDYSVHERVHENGNVVNLVQEKLPEEECGVIPGTLNEKQSGIDDCSREPNGLCVEKVWANDKNRALVNLPDGCNQSVEMIPDSGLVENCDERDLQKNVRSGTAQVDVEDKTDGFTAKESDTCDKIGLSLDCVMSAELRPTDALSGNEIEQEKQQGGDTSLEGVLVVTENKTVDVAGTGSGDHNQMQSLQDSDSMPRLMPTADRPGDCIQQDDQIVNSSSAEGIMNEKSNISSVTEATICDRLVSHQGFDNCSKSVPLIGSPGKNVLQHGVMENSTDGLCVEKTVVENQMPSFTVNKVCMELGTSSCSPGNCCQQIDLKSKLEHAVPLSMALDGTGNALAKLDFDICTHKLLDQIELPKELPIAGFLRTRDVKNDQNKDKDINCLTAYIAPASILENSACTLENLAMADSIGNFDRENLAMAESVVNLGNKKELRDVKPCQRTLENSAMVDSVGNLYKENELRDDKPCERTLENLAIAESFGNLDLENELSDDKIVNVPFVEGEPDVVEEGSDVTTEIKFEIRDQDFPLEGGANDLKVCSPKLFHTIPQSCQSVGATGNSSCMELNEPQYTGKDVFRAMCSSSVAHCHELTNNQRKKLAINDCPFTTGFLEIGSSSSQRGGRTCKSSRKRQEKKDAKKSRNKAKVQDLHIFRTQRKKRSCFSKPARFSNWGLLGNIVQLFEQGNDLGISKIQNHKPSPTMGGKGGGKRNKTRAGGSSRRSSLKQQAPTSCIRLKVKVGNEVFQNGIRVMVPEVIDTSASAGLAVSDLETKLDHRTSFEASNLAEKVKMGEVGTEDQLECCGNKLKEARAHSDPSVLGIHVSMKDSEGIVISQKLSGHGEADYLGIPSHSQAKASHEITEKRYIDPGTSPDSEVINSVPEGQVNRRFQEDSVDAVLTSPKVFVSTGDAPITKKGKKKGRVTHSSGFLLENNSPVMGGLNKVDAPKIRGGRHRKTDGFFSSEFLISSTNVNASNHSPSSKEFAEEQLPFSSDTGVIISKEALPEECSTETKISCGLDDALRLSEAQNLSNLLHSAKPKGSQPRRKSSGASKGGSKLSGKAKSKREDGCKQRRKDKKLVKKNKSKAKSGCNDSIYKKEADAETGNYITEDTNKSNHSDITAPVAEVNLDVTPNNAVEQPLPVDNAWVRCDSCHKWRRIPVALVDCIGQTNCQWICKDNTDKAFADCSVRQEKSNAEINAELGLSDADEDGYEVHSMTKGLGKKRTSVSKEHEFTRIFTNQFLHRSRKTQIIDEIMVCHCKLPPDGRLGCRDECLNRMLNIECVRGTCPCGDHCSNQQFQKRSYAKMKLARCGKKGFGLLLKEDVSQGQFLIEYVGEVLDMDTYEARQRDYAIKGHKHFYFMTLNGSEVIDACAKGNLGRFINHSCDPNCRTEKWVVNGEICIGLFALRDIKKGEEMTFDYNYVRVFGAAAKRCYCGSPHCRSYIGGDPTSTEVVDQVDSDEEFLEPVMLEVGEGGDTIKTTISRTSSFDDVELQAAESISNDRDKVDNSTTASPEEVEDSVKPSTVTSQAHSSLEIGDLNQSCPSSSQQADDATIKSSLATKQEIFIEETCRLENSSATLLSKSSSDGLATIKKPKSEDKRVFVKSRFLIKTSREAGSTKKGKLTSNPPNVNKVPTMANRSQALSIKPKKLMDGISSSRFEAVEEKLNELLDSDGGISKRKDAAKGYLKFLLLTAASGASGNGEAIQSNRDLSMILDALLKTKSRAVLIDIINKNGLQMLHNMLKQLRSDFKKRPILRKLLKVLEYLAAREVLTPEHIYGGPPCPGMESFRKSMLSLTEHLDRQVHQIARSFRDRWFPRHGRNYSYVDRDDGCRGSLSNRFSFTQNHLHGLSTSPTEVNDSAQLSKAATASMDSAVPEGCPSPCVSDGAKTRKRKSRWDQPADEKQSSNQHDELRFQSRLLQQTGYNRPPDSVKDVWDREDNGSREGSCCPHCVRNYRRHVEANAADLGRQNIENDVPPGFSSPSAIPTLVSNDTSSIIADVAGQNVGLMIPDGVVVGHPQKKFISRLRVSYGMPLPIVQQFGSHQDGTAEASAIAPGMPFHPYPPLPAFPPIKNESPAAVNSMAINETVEAGHHLRQDPATCSPHASTTAAYQPHKGIPVENGHQTLKRTRPFSQDLGRRYFRQQKWNKRPPWLRQMNGWGHLGSNSKIGMCSNDVERVTDEHRNSYGMQNVSSRVEKNGDCSNHQHCS